MYPVPFIPLTEDSVEYNRVTSSLKLLLGHSLAEALAIQSPHC